MNVNDSKYEMMPWTFSFKIKNTKKKIIIVLWRKKLPEIIILKKHVLLEGYVNHASWSLQCWCQLSANQAQHRYLKLQYSCAVPPSSFLENKMNKIIIASNIQDKIPPREKMREWERTREEEAKKYTQKRKD